MTQEKNGVWVPGGVLTLQVIMLVIYYGFEKSMPWWVVWFPFLFAASIFGVIIVVAIFAIIIGMITE